MKDRAGSWRRVASGEGTGPPAVVARAALAGLAGLYGLGLALYRAAYDVGLIHPRRLPCPVIGIGNLTVGGTGKTTFTRWLARWLLHRGYHPAILSRGYRSAAGEGPLVVADGGGLRAPVEISGDEPQMLGRSLPGVPVVIGRNRVRSGAVACRKLGADVCLLDDGFQYWRLKKDLELVLVDASCPFGYGALLPRGLLREPLQALRRADAVLLTHADQARAETVASVMRALHERAPAACLATTRHSAVELASLAGEHCAPVSRLGNGRWAALSSVGQPASFEATLAAAGATDILPFRFPDHHRYRLAEIRAVVERARQAGCQAIVTTEKDAVKLEATWFGDLPCWVLRVDLEFLSGQDEIQQLLCTRLGARAGKEAPHYQTA
ncbi:MAG: tetraacyldisaccharide 4'-kinase [Armatimonadetes bacterium]|nr:tetraacyldisaccharide 4'-kinase [Armatimonadota bacterium]